MAANGSMARMAVAKVRTFLRDERTRRERMLSGVSRAEGLAAIDATFTWLDVIVSALTEMEQARGAQGGLFDEPKNTR